MRAAGNVQPTTVPGAATTFSLDGSDGSTLAAPAGPGLRHPAGEGEELRSALEMLAPAGPIRGWFGRREVVLGAAACLTLGTFLLRELGSSGVETVGLLYVIPVALVGLELGLRAGVTAALAALLLVAARPPSSDMAANAVGLAMRGIALLAVGVIAGRFSDHMRATQAQLEDHFRSAGHILGVHERERHKIAEQLHEQAAQAMAAALLLVGRLQAESADHLPPGQLAEVRDSVHDCIAHLRRLAATLRSPVLAELGLVPALERIFESRHGEARLVIALDSDGLPGRLPPAAEVLAYRVLEEIVGCLAGTVTVRMGLESPDRLRIKVEGLPSVHTPSDEVNAVLGTTRARLEIVGGAMVSSRSSERVEVAAEIPVRVAVSSNR